MTPTKNFRFRVEIEGLDAGGFSEVTGFDATFDVIEYRTGDDPMKTPHKDPGLVKYSNVTLKQGITDNMVLVEWLNDVREGTIEKKTVTITALDETGADDASWQLKSAWPVKYTGPDFNATASEVAFESIELAHEEIVRVS